MDKRIRRARVPLPIIGVLNNVVPIRPGAAKTDRHGVNATDTVPRPFTAPEERANGRNNNNNNHTGNNGRRHHRHRRMKTAAAQPHGDGDDGDTDVLMLAAPSRPVSAPADQRRLHYTASVRRFRHNLGRVLQKEETKATGAGADAFPPNPFSLDATARGRDYVQQRRQQRAHRAGHQSSRGGVEIVAGGEMSSRTLLAQADDSDWERVPFSFFIDGYVHDSQESLGGASSGSSRGGRRRGRLGRQRRGGDEPSSDADHWRVGPDSSGSSFTVWDARPMRGGGGKPRTPPVRYYMAGGGGESPRKRRKKRREKKKKKKKAKEHRKHNWNDVWMEVTGQRPPSEAAKGGGGGGKGRGKGKGRNKRKGRRNKEERRADAEEEEEEAEDKARKKKAGRAWIARMKQTIAKRLRARGLVLRSPQHIKQAGGARSVHGRLPGLGRVPAPPAIAKPASAAADEGPPARLRPLESILTPGMPSSKSMLTPAPAAPSHHRAGSEKGRSFGGGGGGGGLDDISLDDSFTSAGTGMSDDDGVFFPAVDVAAVKSDGGHGDAMGDAASVAGSAAATAGGSFRSTSTWTVMSLGSGHSLKDGAGGSFRKRGSNSSMRSAFCVSVASSNSRGN